MDKIRNTLFDHSSTIAPLGQQIQWVKNAFLAVNNATSSVINTRDTDYTLSVPELTTYYVFLFSSIKFYYEAPTTALNILFGEDSPEFAATLIDAFYLTDTITDVTDNISIDFILLTPPPATAIGQNVYLGTNEGTSNYVTFENLSGGGASDLAMLFKAANVGPFTVTVNIRATDFTPGSQTVEITWTN
jgi:hypothetical protein